MFLHNHFLPFHCNLKFHFILHTYIHTDISAGYSPSVFNAMRVAIHTSKALSLTVNRTDYQPLTHHEAFYLATLGGAQGQGVHNQEWKTFRKFINGWTYFPMVDVEYHSASL